VEMKLCVGEEERWEEVGGAVICSGERLASDRTR
jgi:hypothetical protein